MHLKEMTTTENLFREFPKLLIGKLSIERACIFCLATSDDVYCYIYYSLGSYRIRVYTIARLVVIIRSDSGVSGYVLY